MKQFNLYRVKHYIVAITNDESGVVLTFKHWYNRKGRWEYGAMSLEEFNHHLQIGNATNVKT